MGKTKKNKTGNPNPEKLNKVKQTSTFKPHNKKKTNRSKDRKSITGSLLENVVKNQQKHFSNSIKKKTKGGKAWSKLNNKESAAIQKQLSRGQSAFTVVKGSEQSESGEVGVDLKTSSSRNGPSVIQKKDKVTVDDENTAVNPSSSQDKATKKLPLTAKTGKDLAKSVEKNNSKNQEKSVPPTKIIKKKNKSGSKDSRKDPGLNRKRKQQTKEILMEETSVSTDTVASRKVKKDKKSKVDKLPVVDKSKNTEKRVSEGGPSSTNQTQSSADLEHFVQSSGSLDPEVIDLISSESEMSDSDFSIVDLTVDDPESEVVNFEPEESQGELSETVDTDIIHVLSPEEAKGKKPESQNVGGSVSDVASKMKSKKAAKVSTKSTDLEEPRFHVLAAFDSQVLLVIPQPGVYCFLGRCFLKCLHGQAEVLGYQLTDQFQAFYSPACNSLLTVTTSPPQFTAPKKVNSEPPSGTSKKNPKNKKKTTEVSVTEPETVKKIYSEWLLLSSDMEKLPKDNVCILLVRRLDSNICDYIATFKAFTRLWDNPDPPKQRPEERDPWEEKLEAVGLTYIPEQAEVSRQRVSPEQKEVLQKWDKVLKSDKEPVMMVVGGKNSGKSTLNRYLLNHTLNKLPEVCYLECDIGQTEFTPPGCVSLQVLSTPVLGPPFTHQKRPKICYYYGGLSASDSPNLYTECIRTCLQEYWSLQQKHESKLPLVVNTMGWIEDLGLELLISIIRMTLPSLLVQINFPNPKMNAERLTPEFVNDRQGWMGHSRFYKSCDLPGLQGTTRHALVSLHSPASDVRRKDQWKPFELRDLAVISYMSSVLSKDSSLSLETPYGVPWGSIAINICRKGVPKAEWIAAINATMVGLAQADLSQAKKTEEEEPYFFDNTPICHCIGIGMVRAIDVKKKMIYITTPLSLVDLVDVNTIIRGSSNVPQQIFTEQITKEEREIPYVTRITPTVASKNPRQRKHIPSRKRATESNTAV